MSHHENKKPDYDENLFITHLPAFAFLCIAVIAMVISVIKVIPSKDPFPNPTLTAEESLALIQPVVSVGGGAEGASSVAEPEGLVLMKSTDCFACHKEKEKLLGPSFADVAAKYKADKNIEKILVNKVKAGGSGVWGPIPMSPHPTLKDEDLAKMVQYIMSIKGGVVAPAVAVAVETKTTAPESSLPAHEGFAIIQKNDCIACHKNDVKLLGPAYQDVAEKYKDDKEAVKKLLEKVKKGGAGVWGDIPMGPHPAVSDEDLTKMIEAILTLKKGAVEAPKVEVVANEFTAGFEAIKKSDCMACHKEKEKLVGPSFLEIANKYKESKDIKALAAKIKAGGSGVWGPIPMLAHPQLSEEEIEKMVQAVLSVK